MRTLCAIGVVVVALGFSPDMAAQTVYRQQHDMLVQTIRNGSADGVVAGDVADVFKRQFKSDGQLLAQAKVIGHFSNPDCKRIEVAYTKKEVITDKGPQDVKMNMKLNYCIDGTPPIGQEMKQ